MKKENHRPKANKHLAPNLGLHLVLGLLMLTAGPARAQSQRMAIPAYFEPGPLWTQMGAATPRLGLAVLNPDSGPGDAVRAEYVPQVRAAQARGVIVLGYVRTSYGKRPLAQVQAEVDRFNRWYGVNGIFFDEARNDDAGLPYYLRCRAAARTGHRKAVVAINPGTPVTEGYLAVADVVLTFEGDYGAYLTRAADPSWVARHPARRFWHLVYAAPDAPAMRRAVMLSKTRNAGWVYVTPDTLPNPWDTLPSGSYWSGELAALGVRSARRALSGCLRRPHFASIAPRLETRSLILKHAP